MSTAAEFEVRDMVSWAEGQYQKELRKKYGAGPFLVIRTELIPEDRCGCGLRVEHPGRSQWCGKTARQHAGHAQYLHLRGEEGRPIMMLVSAGGRASMSTKIPLPISFPGSLLRRS